MSKIMKLNMKNNLVYKIMMLVVAMICAASCSTITEFPDENPVDPTLVNVNITISSDSEFENLARSNTKNTDGSIKQRFIVEAYKFDNTTTPAKREEIYADKSDIENTLNVSLKLHATKYRIVIWSDYVQTASPSDMYYYTAETLRKIKYNGEYIANKDEKDCFYAHEDLDLTKYSGEWNVSVDVDMSIQRPVGKFIMISDDVETYITRANSRGETISRSDLNSYTAKVSYSGFAPNGFDAYDGVLNDAITGISYDTQFQIINDNEAMVAFDYVLADKSGTSYDIAIQIFDDKGKLINEVGSKKATVVCGETTTLKSDFLTGDYKPGISIDTDYDGTFDVVLPD